MPKRAYYYYQIFLQWKVMKNLTFYKIFKTEFAFNKRFANLEELERELFDYVNWYNNVRIHGSLNYQTPVAYRLGLSL